MHDAIVFHLEGLRDAGEPIPEPSDLIATYVIISEANLWRAWCRPIGVRPSRVDRRAARRCGTSIDMLNLDDDVLRSRRPATRPSSRRPRPLRGSLPRLEYGPPGVRVT